MTRRWRTGILSVAGLLAGPWAACGEISTPPEPAALKQRLVQDMRALVPEREEIPTLLAGTVGVLLLARADRAPSRYLAAHTPERVTSVEPLGRYAAGNVLGLSFLAAGLATGEKHLPRLGLAFVEANLLSSWAVAGVQNVAGRARPWQDHAGEFGRGGSSFPSAHAAHAFAWAGVLWAGYPRFEGRWVFPLLASSVALSRVKERQHFLADVVAGAGIGWYLGSRLGARAAGASPPSVTVAPGPRAVWCHASLP